MTPIPDSLRPLLERIANDTDCRHFIGQEQEELRALLAQPASPTRSVPVELLERVAKPVETQYDRDQRWKALEELRAILATPPAEHLPPLIQCLRENGQQLAERAFDAQEAKYPQPQPSAGNGGTVTPGFKVVRQHGECVAYEQPSAVQDAAEYTLEREAFEAQAPYRTDMHAGVYESQRTADGWAGFKAGAAWQRTQSAGVPEGWRLELMGPDEVVKLTRQDGKWCGVTHLSTSPRDELLYWFLRAMLAAASKVAPHG